MTSFTPSERKAANFSEYSFAEEIAKCEPETCVPSDIVP
jgi:hypothetical protein